MRPPPSCSPSTRRGIDAARGEAQKFIADGRARRREDAQPICSSTRARSSRTCSSALAATSRARSDKAIAQLRREAVDLALAGASKVIEQNLESQKNRQLVESYLGVARLAQGQPVMREPTIAKNYAETLLELAQQADDLRGWGEMIEAVADAMDTDRRCACSSSRRA